jgi:hypothetical protein
MSLALSEDEFRENGLIELDETGSRRCCSILSQDGAPLLALGFERPRGSRDFRTRMGAMEGCRNIFTDFKRHDVGPFFYERDYGGSVRKQFLTTPLWGVGSTGPYGHDGRSLNLTEVILRPVGRHKPPGTYAELTHEQDWLAVARPLGAAFTPSSRTSSRLVEVLLEPLPDRDDFRVVGHGPDSQRAA